MGDVTDRRTCDVTKYTAADMVRNNYSECSEDLIEEQNRVMSEVEKEVQVEVEVGEVVRSKAWMGEEVLCVLLYMLRGSLDDRIVSTHPFRTLCIIFTDLLFYFYFDVYFNASNSFHSFSDIISVHYLFSQIVLLVDK